MAKTCKLCLAKFDDEEGRDEHATAFHPGHEADAKPAPRAAAAASKVATKVEAPTEEAPKESETTDAGKAKDETEADKRPE